MKALIGYVSLLVGILVFSLFSTPHYGDCKQTIEGRECVLTHYTFGR